MRLLSVPTYQLFNFFKKLVKSGFVFTIKQFYLATMKV